MRIRIRWIFMDDDVEILAGQLVIANHLVRLRSLMKVSQITWHLLDAFSVGKY